MTPSPEDIEHACLKLAEQNACFQRAFDRVGVPDWRATEPTYQSLASLVAYQLLSTKAAATIWGRILDWAGGTVTTQAVLSAEDDTLRACGLSGPKVRHLKSIAEAIETNALPINDLHAVSDDEARKLLCAVKGIGPWTAEVFIMNALGRMDAFPHGDVGLMEAHKMLTGLDVRLDAKAFSKLAENWRPYRGVAAHLLWAYINASREN